MYQIEESTMFLVYDDNDKVIHKCHSYHEAMSWINGQIDELAEHLKECPFCGKKLAFLDRQGMGCIEWWVICPTTKGGCGAHTAYVSDPARAMELWNRREAGGE